MNVIFLDDSPIRTKQFRSFHPSTKFAATAPEVIEILQSHKDNDELIDWLFLDHDLGGEEYVNPLSNDTGMEVVRWIIKNTPKITRIIVHTCNHSAGWTMLNKLRGANYNTVYIPYTEFKEEIYAIGLQ